MVRKRLTPQDQEDVMSLHSAAPALLAFARYFARPNCPQCGNSQFAPERSEFVEDGVIHHTWACEACGHEFRTTVEFERAAA
jgi:rubredoxin